MQSAQSDGRYFAHMMEMSLEYNNRDDHAKLIKKKTSLGNISVKVPRLNLIGSAVFENMETGEVDLCIFRSLDKRCREYYP